MITKARATIDDLLRVPGKAELIDGAIVHFMPTGGLPNYAAGEIFAHLREYAKRTKRGRAITDNAGFRIRTLPHRESFSPDAAYYVGPDPGMKFYEGAPAFAAEVRSEGDYGPQAESAMAGKRADHFAAGTLVVWDVDLQSTDVVKVYRASSPSVPTIYRRGDMAEAEPAVPEWAIPINDLLEEETE